MALEAIWKLTEQSMFIYCQFVVRGTSNRVQFYEMPGHRHRINRVINVQVNTLFTETFPTMVNLELPNFHKWSRLIVARDTFTMIPPVYFALFAKFSQMFQVDCCWRLGCPKKTFIEISL